MSEIRARVEENEGTERACLLPFVFTHFIYQSYKIAKNYCIKTKTICVENNLKFGAIFI